MTQFLCPNLSEKFSLLFRRERGDDFLEARIAPEGIPNREQFQGTVVQHELCDGSTQPSFQLLQSKLLVAKGNRGLGLRLQGFRGFMMPQMSN